MTAAYDVIVLGVGGFGSGALYHLARQRARALGIEQFDIAHDRGSSHGQTRIIRQAYFEHPDYVPLLLRAYALWRELEHETQSSLLHQVGLLIAGRSDCESVRGTLDAARVHRLPVEKLTAAEATVRYPAFRFRDEDTVVFEAQAGYLAVEACVAAHVQAAVARGATVHTGETVRSFTGDGAGVRVTTDRGEYRAARMIITAGPWAGRLLAHGADATSAGDSRWTQGLNVVRKPVFWFPAGAPFDASRGTPTFFFEDGSGQFYGFPRLDGATIKVAEHTLGDAVDDPGSVDRTMHAADLERVAHFLDARLPGVAPQPARHSVCLYTRTPDCHFVIDRLPGERNVVVGAGFSGHGFKFTSVLGQALADLALSGKTDQPIDFLSLQRLSGREPAAPA